MWRRKWTLILSNVATRMLHCSPRLHILFSSLYERKDFIYFLAYVSCGPKDREGFMKERERRRNLATRQDVLSPKRAKRSRGGGAGGRNDCEGRSGTSVGTPIFTFQEGNFKLAGRWSRDCASYTWRRRRRRSEPSKRTDPILRVGPS